MSQFAKVNIPMSCVIDDCKQTDDLEITEIAFKSVFSMTLAEQFAFLLKMETFFGSVLDPNTLEGSKQLENVDKID